MVEPPSHVTPCLRRTLAGSFVRAGVGVHTGAAAVVCVEPAPFGSGLRVLDEGGRALPVCVTRVRASAGATTLGGDGLEVAVVEHLLAALYASGVTDASIVVRGPELPALDGSALPWLDAIDEAGTVTGPPARVREVVGRVRVQQGRAWAEVWPAARTEVSVSVDFGPSLQGEASIVVEPGAFRREIAWARTFAFASDVDELLAQGRGVGATSTNTVVIGDDGPIYPLRGRDEPVRHKLLDAIGDLALSGAPLRGRVHVHRGTHALHHALVSALVHDASAWRWVEGSEGARA